ncbi:hypothetical protein U5640_04105 [Streptomyces sp. SS7]|uniref:ComEC/Rec2 family competence protein n=1 Tax=Streptomyces sp. SS7 TaxID=3108485 RepID=UPI0030ED00BA
MPGKKRQRTEDTPVLYEKRVTRSQLEGERKAKKAKEEEDAVKERQRLWEERQAEIRGRHPDPVGDCGDGNLYVAFVEVGQGDFAVMSTPGGKVIVFDGGSLSTDDEDAGGKMNPESKTAFTKRLHSVLTDEKFLGNRNVIDILILTHPDSDHYNKLAAVLGDRYTIDKCYHSGNFDKYSVAKTSAFLDPITRIVQKVVKSHDPIEKKAAGEVTLQGRPVQAKDEENTVDRLDDEGGILILDEGKSCQISIIAAGITYEYKNDGSNDTNRGSIVTLVEANGAKVLMMGDATKNTEQFLLNTAAKRLTKLNLVQAAHHGSVLTSSSQEFVDLVDPAEAVASAGRKIPKHRHPSDDVIKRYVERLETSERPEISSHTTYVWPGLGEGKPYSYKSTQNVFSTGSRGTFIRKFGAST